MQKKNIIIAQSGGPTVAINASLAGVLSAAMQSESYDTVYGALNGILGIMNDRFLNLSEKAKKTPDFIDTLKITPGQHFGTHRGRSL